MTTSLSIITVCFNAERHIAQTLESVAAQTYPYIEHIVVDGASTDNTAAIIEDHRESLACIVSEPDDGIAHAMNKGLRLARGDLIMFLNADDYLIDSTAIADAISLIEKASPSCAEIFAFELIKTGRSKPQHLIPLGWGWKANFKMPVWHPSTMVARELYHRLNGFDARFRIAFDYDFFLRCVRAGVSAIVFKMPLTVMRDIGVSSRLDCPALRQRLREEQRVHQKNVSSTLLRAVYHAYWLLYPMYRSILCGQARQAH